MPIATALTPDDYVIYDVIINNNWRGQAQLVIWATSLTNYGPGGRLDMRGYVASQLPGLQDQTADSFLAANQAAYLLTNQFHLSSPIVFFTRADQLKIFEGDLQTAWRQFYMAYPGSQGILGFSRAGFNNAMDQALVYYHIARGRLNGAGYMVLLSKAKTGWLITNQLMLWIS
jgi:hypothetical protein